MTLAEACARLSRRGLLWVSRQHFPQCACVDCRAASELEPEARARLMQEDFESLENPVRRIPMTRVRGA